MVSAYQPRTMGRLEVAPYQKVGNLHEGETVTVYWLGVGVVQERTYNQAIADGKCVIKDVNGRKVIEEVEVPLNPTEWSQITLYVTERAIRMPMLGESLTIPYSIFLELVEKSAPGNLMTEREGGAAVAAALKQQIQEGVRLFDIQLNEMQSPSQAEPVNIESLSTEELLEEIKNRGLVSDDEEEVNKEEVGLSEPVSELLTQIKKGGE
jgi:hypothetical protein